jgi:hypothetical protein
MDDFSINQSNTVLVDVGKSNLSTHEERRGEAGEGKKERTFIPYAICRGRSRRHGWFWSWLPPVMEDLRA